MNIIDKLKKNYNSSTHIFIHSSLIYIEDYNKLDLLFSEIKENNLQLKTYYLFKHELRYFERFGLNIFLKVSTVLGKSLINNEVSIIEDSIYDIKNTIENGIQYKKVIILVGNLFNLLDFCKYFNNKNVLIGYLEPDLSNIQLFQTNEMCSKKNDFLFNGVWDNTKIDNLDEKNGYYYKNPGLIKIILKDEISLASGESNVFETSLNDLVCKIYYKNILTKGYENKLKKILSYNFEGKATFPKYLVYDKNSNVVGFLMNKVSKNSLTVLISNTELDELEYKKKIYKVLISIIDCMLSLHTQNILVGDLKPTNIHYDEIYDIFFIDTDSFQYGDYIGLGYTTDYCHKDIDTNSIDKKLRLFYHEYYALSVLVFQSLNYNHFPLENINNTLEFQLTYDEVTSNCSVKKRKSWKSLPKNIQNMFVDQFSKYKVITPIEWKIALQKELIKTIRISLKDS